MIALLGLRRYGARQRFLLQQGGPNILSGPQQLASMHLAGLAQIHTDHTEQGSTLMRTVRTVRTVLLECTNSCRLWQQHSGLHTTAGSSAAGTEQQRSSRSQQGRRSPLGDAASSPGPDPGIGTIYVQCTKNNTICTLVDIKGMPLAWTSAGSCGFKNARKKSTQVSQTVAEILVQKVIDRGFREVRVVMKGMGYGKQAAVRAIAKSRLRVLEIHEQTPIPHNGCRAPKRRRI